MMTGKQKLYFLLDAIEDARVLAPSGQPLKIHATHDLRGNYRGIELDQLFMKLEKDEKVIKIIKSGNRIKEVGSRYGLNEPDDGCYHIGLLTGFNNYYFQIQNEPEYQEFTGKNLPPNTFSKQQAEDKATEPVFHKTISATPIYSTKSRQIADQFSPENHQFILMVLREIILLVDFSIDGKVQYYLQSPSGHPNLIKERSLLNKFEQQGLFRNLGEDGILGILTLSDLDTKLIKEVIARLEERESGLITSEELEEIKAKNKYEKLVEEIRKPSEPSLEARYNNLLKDIKPKQQKNNNRQKLSKKPQVVKKQPTSEWSEDFKWQGNKQFVFGEYGVVNFNSQARIDLFRELTKAKGGWVTVKKLKEITGKDDSFVRPTIGQIERKMKAELKSRISFPSTGEDNLQPKPSQGAYRIKFTPKSL